MKKYFLFASLLFAWTLTSCDSDDSSDIEPDVPFYQNLGVSYDVTNNKTNVGANFNKQDSAGINIKLNGPASILFNGKAPNFANVGIYFYTYSFKGLEDMTFTFTRAKDEVYTNVASIKDVKPIAIPESFTSAKVKGTTTLTWEGDPVGPNEVVEVTISYDGGVNSIFNRDEGSRSINITFSNSSLPGKATLSLSRAKVSPLQESNGSASGQLDVSYVQSKEIRLE